MYTHTHAETEDVQLFSKPMHVRRQCRSLFSWTAQLFAALKLCTLGTKSQLHCTVRCLDLSLAMRHFGGRDDLVVHVVPNDPDHFLAKTAFNFEYETAMCNFPMSCCAPMFWLGCVLEEFWHKVAQITSWAAGKKYKKVGSIPIFSSNGRMSSGGCRRWMTSAWQPGWLVQKLTQG